MHRILSGAGIVGSSSTSASLTSACWPLAAAASWPSALSAMTSRRLDQRWAVRFDRSTMPPSTTAPNLAAPAWRKLTNRMGVTQSDRLWPVKIRRSRHAVVALEVPAGDDAALDLERGLTALGKSIAGRAADRDGRA